MIYPETGQDYRKDRYGPLEYVIHDIKCKLPRSAVGETHFVATKAIILNFLGVDKQNDKECYSASSFSRKETLSKMEATLTVKHYIWNNFFGLAKNCTYCEHYHYPISLRFNLKDKLNIKNIDSLKSLQEFIEQVMNAVFDRVVYVFDSKLLAAANDVCKGIVQMESVTSYKIKKNYKYWLGE